MYCMQKYTSLLGSYLINPLIQYEKRYCRLHCVGATFFTVIISNTTWHVNYSCQLIYPLVTFRFHNASKKRAKEREKERQSYLWSGREANCLLPAFMVTIYPKISFQLPCPFIGSFHNSQNVQVLKVIVATSWCIQMTEDPILSGATRCLLLSSPLNTCF